MPDVLISGTTSEEDGLEDKISFELKKYFAAIHNFHLSDTTVTFIHDKNIGPDEHIMARLSSKKFMGMGEEELDSMCSGVNAILKIAKHPFVESIVLPVLMMKGEWLGDKVGDECSEVCVATDKVGSAGVCSGKVDVVAIPEGEEVLIVRLTDGDKAWVEEDSWELDPDFPPSGFTAVEIPDLLIEEIEGNFFERITTLNQYTEILLRKIVDKVRSS